MHGLLTVGCRAICARPPLPEVAHRSSTSVHGIFIDEERLKTSPIGEETNIRAGPFRMTLSLHPDIEASGDADFMPLSATAAPRQALTDTFDPQASSSIAVVMETDDRKNTVDMAGDAFSPVAQIASGFCTSGTWMDPHATMRKRAWRADYGLPR